jgi:hypothetical protein
VNVLSQFLDEQEAARPKGADADLLEWLNAGVSPEVRLLKFDKWAGHQLATKLDWAWAGEAKARKIEQYRVHLERLVLELWRRGWMLDGKRLAFHIETALDRIGKYQKTGEVKELWPYYRSVIDRYVGANAEELQAEAMRAGSHVGQLLTALGVKGAGTGPTLPEMVAQRADEITTAKTLRQKLTTQRKKEAAREVGAHQPELL